MNRTVFITGVSSGIGHGLASGYLDQKDDVYGVSRRSPNDLIERDGFHFSSIDLCDEESVAVEIPNLLKRVKKIDTVILNAGILGEIADMRETSLRQLREIMDINVWACKSTLDALYSAVTQIDRVITISSGAAINGNRGWNGYSISKAALNMLTQLYARENESTHFVAVAPGLVDTAMQDYLCGREDDSRFPSLEVLKSKRNTIEMPKPVRASKKLMSVFDGIEEIVPTGGFIDIRQLPDLAPNERI